MIENTSKYQYRKVFRRIVGWGEKSGKAFQPSYFTVLKRGHFALWYLNGVQGVASTNLAVPTI